MNSTNEAENQLKTLGPVIFGDVLDAHKSKDYSKMVSLLSEHAKEGFSEHMFYEAIENQLQQLGAATEIIYLGSLRKSGGTLTVWKVQYEQKQELLWQLLLTNDSNPKVAGLLFS